MQTREITFQSGTATLAGTFACDPGTGPGPAALLISGSGPIDRDSDVKKLPIGVMRQVAEHLAARGIQSFRYDKRGVGASDGDFSTTGFLDNVADARAAIEMLRSRPEVDPRALFVIGHSEGALIATELAADDATLAGVVLLAGTANDGESVLRWQAVQVAAGLPAAVKRLLRLLRQDISKTQSKRLAQLKATTADSVRIQLVKINAKWMREFMAHHPGPSLEAIRIPVLAITGSKDIQVDPDDVERICRLVPSGCTGHVLDDATHLLRTEPGPPTVRTYKKQARRPVDPELLDVVSQWIAVQVGNDVGRDSAA